MRIDLETSWQTLLQAEFDKPYMQALQSFLQQEQKQGQVVYPKPEEVFKALNLTPFHQVKVVILGQDPYHGPQQAHGLSFSVPQGIKLPPSLRNIYKELKADLSDYTIPAHGDLSHWAKQGVLLLNASLTVRASEAGSHQKKGWEQFTDKIIQLLSAERSHLVFILWGKYAQSKALLIDGAKHLILQSAHPSPLSAYQGFLGSKPFSKTNTYLQDQGEKPIVW